MKKLLAFFTAILLTGTTHAQNFEWVKSAGGGLFDVVFDADVDHSENIYVTGTYNYDFSNGTASVPEDTLVFFDDDTFTGVHDIFFTKLDRHGNTLWNRAVHGDGVNNGYSVAADDFGNVYLAGHNDWNSTYLTFGDTTIPAPGGFLAKYDSSGNVLWARSVGDTRIAFVETDAAGNVYVAGGFWDTVVIVGSIRLSLPITGSTNSIIAKFDAAGNALWAKAGYSTSSTISAEVIPGELELDAQGNAYIHGHLRHTAKFGQYTISGQGADQTSYFIVKYDPSGNEVFAKVTPVKHGFSALAIDEAGSIYISGGASTTVPAPIFIKYDSQMNELWRKPLAFSSIVAHGSNLYVVCSFSDSITIGSMTITDPTPPLGNVADEYFLFKLDTAGNPIWATHFPFYEMAECFVELSPQGTPVIAGSYLNPFAVDTFNFQAVGYSDVFIASLSDTISVYSVEMELCDGESYQFGGTTLTTAGSFTHTFTAADGSDSIVNITITILSPLEPVITQNGLTLSTDTFATYQWMLNDKKINGATAPQVNISGNGNYWVIVTDANGCTDTSAIYTVTGVGIGNIQEPKETFVNAFPNPFSEKLNIEFMLAEDENVRLEVYNITGQLLATVFAGDVRANELIHTEFTADIPSGMVFYRLQGEKTVRVGKVLVER